MELNELKERAWVEVDLDAFRSNVRLVASQAGPGVKKCLVIKADAYGLGAVTIAQETEDLADFFAVACEQEAVELGNAGVTKPILILGASQPSLRAEMIRRGVRLNVFSDEQAEAVSAAAAEAGLPAYVHFSLNTGMNRIGFAISEETVASIVRAASLPGIVPEGIFSHFAASDDDPAFTAEQYRRFSWVVSRLEEEGVHIPIPHIANSASALMYPGNACAMQRFGICLYGASPSDLLPEALKPKPVMSLKARVTMVKTVPVGETVGYNRTFRADEPRRIATVSIGYADGYPRCLSGGRGSVLIRGQRAPIAGRVAMDQMMVDVTGIPEAAAGDEAVLIGTSGENGIRLEEVCGLAGTIPHEVLVNLSRRRLPHIYKRTEE